MVTIVDPEHTTAHAIYALYERRAASEKHRGYLGASIIGEPCERKLWYTFHWCDFEQFDGRMLKLFDTGHREEARFAVDLRAIGVELHTHQADGTQYGFRAIGGHFRGHLDGVGRGFVEAPKAWHVWESKSANEKSFNDLVRHGVETAKPIHYAQMQIGMHYLKIDRAMYTVVNKNTDDVYTERIEYDVVTANQLIAKAERIIASPVPLPHISEDASWWQCKFCNFSEICHGAEVPRVNCRTCAHSTPVMEGEDGNWHCTKWNANVPNVEEQAICDKHVFLPVLLERFAKAIDADLAAGTVTYEGPGGVFVNGQAPAGFTSQEIRAAGDKRALVNVGLTAELRESMGGRIVA